MDLITHPLSTSANGLPEIKLPVDRHTLAKRRWRGKADDGRDFGFDLTEPLKHRSAFFETNVARYVIAQTSEPVLSVLIVTPSQAARVAWQVGNLHFPLAVREDSVLVEDDVAMRQMFARENITFRVVREIFQPVGGAAGHHHH